MANDIFFSLFMFTANVQPGDVAYGERLFQHMRKIAELGYNGFDIPVAAQETADHAAEIELYRGFRSRLEQAGLAHLGFTTNVGATRSFDPTSPYKEQRESALAYLKSRVEITAILGGKTVMAGPIVFPYGVFPVLDDGTPLWSDALQDWLKARYEAAEPVISELATYADKKDVKLAIEPVDHWETPAPNMVSDVLDFLVGIKNPTAGLTVDSAHVVLGSNGPLVFKRNITDLLVEKRLHYVHVSAPDRGELKDSWIPWETFLPPIQKQYTGPYLIEVFNAVPPFLQGLRITRRKFWIPGEDTPVPGAPSAYDVAIDGLSALRQALGDVT
ncbi:sugar phosphate isomerase/epimerase family protein [Agrobacterium larrymoorei]|uniref:sugar phosphate isomerase/epimerase family protein n=1 Tax=Agrobacterium larrymoorei TaxID=160699 RepID=UPI001F17FD3C|nr:sugar phosphate isomerase/epimerase [Agrobacterium larrymoorei]